MPQLAPRLCLRLCLGLILSGLAVLLQAAEPPTKNARLPTFTSGETAGLYAVYNDSYFDAEIDAEGLMRVYIKDNNKRVGYPIEFGRFGCSYVRGGTSARRIIAKWDDVKGPLKQPSTVTLKGEFEGGVEFIQKITFGSHFIKFTAGYEDPKDIPEKSYAGMSAYFRRSHTIAADVEQPEREKLLDGIALKTKEDVAGRTKRFTYPYAKTYAFSGTIEEAEVVGLFGKRVVQVEGDRFGDREVLRGNLYPGGCPWEGYWFSIQLIEQTLRPKVTLELRVR